MRLRPTRRWALLLVASALAAGPFAVPSAAVADTGFGCSGGEACVHITFPDGGHDPVDVPASTIADNADVNGVTYEVLYPGNSPEYDTVTGVSVRSLLTALIPDPIDADSVTYTLAQNPSDDYESPLQAGDLSNPSPFYQGLEPVIAPIGGSNGYLEYTRPQRTPDDENYKDHFQTGTLATTINLQVFTQGALVHPSVTIGRGTFRAGQPVPFTTSFAAGDPPHPGATFEWTYADGDPPVPGAQSVTHVYGHSGSYGVSVSVSGNDPDGGSYYGQSPQVIVQIGARKAAGGGKTPGGGGGSTKKHAPPRGPNNGRGHHAGEHPHGSPTAGGSSAGGRAASSGSGTSGGTPSAPGSASASSVASSGATTSPAAQPSARHDAGVVHGVLINGPVAGGAPSSTAVPAAAAARLPARPSGSIDLRWLWLLAPIALLAAGALGERRRPSSTHGRQSLT